MTTPGFLDPGLRGRKPATNRLSYGAAQMKLNSVFPCISRKTPYPEMYKQTLQVLILSRKYNSSQQFVSTSMCVTSRMSG
jgi:hypothetical protein